jgi:arylformamidase|tara:strand:+ start:759 stop:1514 length:756 start_codon:yes stop_codon:yes gene_type:complete
MKFYLEDGKSYIDSNEGIDISIVIGSGHPKVKAWYLDDPKIEPVKAEGFIGSVEKGAPVNFRNIFFNPHAHGTHTEGLGHITKKVYSVNKIKHPLLYKAKLVSIAPVQVEIENGTDAIITTDQIRNLGLIEVEALVIRTLPNSDTKLQIDYSNTNPCYFEAGGAEILREAGVKHLLVDLPSVDKENDNGLLQFHHSFWAVPESPDMERTITEFVFIPTEVEDGNYLLNLQVAPFENDASPSRPILYKMFTT